MKLFVKKNYLSIFSLIILLVWSFYSLSTLKMPKETNDPLICFYIIVCDKMLLLMIIAPLFVIIPSIYDFHKELHSGFIKNCLMRTSYKKYIVKLYLKSLSKSIFILPVFIIILLLMCCVKTGNISFGSGINYYGYFTSPPIQFGNIIIKFMFCYLAGIILNSIFYLNLGIIFVKKNSNIFVSIILAFISFIVIDIIGEGFIGGLLFAKILGIHHYQDFFNLFNVWVYDGIKNLGLCLLYYLALSIISCLVVYFYYKNKEDVIIEIEK